MGVIVPEFSFLDIIAFREPILLFVSLVYSSFWFPISIDDVRTVGIGLLANPDFLQAVLCVELFVWALGVIDSGHPMRVSSTDQPLKPLLFKFRRVPLFNVLQGQRISNPKLNRMPFIQKFPILPQHRLRFLISRRRLPSQVIFQDLTVMRIRLRQRDQRIHLRIPKSRNILVIFRSLEEMVMRRVIAIVFRFWVRVLGWRSEGVCPWPIRVIGLVEKVWHMLCIPGIASLSAEVFSLALLGKSEPGVPFRRVIKSLQHMEGVVFVPGCHDGINKNNGN